MLSTLIAKHLAPFIPDFEEYHRAGLPYQFYGKTISLAMDRTNTQEEFDNLYDTVMLAYAISKGDTVMEQRYYVSLRESI